MRYFSVTNPPYFLNLSSYTDILIGDVCEKEIFCFAFPNSYLIFAMHYAKRKREKDICYPKHS